MHDSPTEAETTLAARARRRIGWRLLPFLFLLYIIAYLDRVNVSYAGLQMTGDLGFLPRVFGFGSGIFFIGYFIFEIPGSVLVETWSARGWIARIMISWGVLAVAMAFIHSASQFYTMRFFLGAAEAGFFPGLLVYLSHWFRQEDRGKAVALMMSAVPLSNVMGAPISGWLMETHWHGFAGWRFLFIAEGLPAILLGIVTIFYLTDKPQQAKWLPEDERAWLQEQLARERATKLAQGSVSIWQVLKQRNVLLLTLAYFGMVNSLYGFNFWLPTIVKKISGFNNFSTILISALPYVVGFVAMLLIGWSSDKRHERRWHTIVPLCIASIGLLCGALLQDHILWSMICFCIAAIGVFGTLPGFWASAYSMHVGVAAAVAIGLINSIGNLGGFSGPYVVGYLNDVSGNFIGGILYLSAAAALAAGCMLALRLPRRK